jgi:hypothetical protein
MRKLLLMVRSAERASRTMKARLSPSAILRDARFVRAPQDEGGVLGTELGYSVFRYSIRS